MEQQRCAWAGTDPRMIAYHDQEWGVPVHDDRLLFEFLTLEGAQAGLSWQTILNKRDAYREAFAGFDPARVARFDSRRIVTLPFSRSIMSFGTCGPEPSSCARWSLSTMRPRAASRRRSRSCQFSTRTTRLGSALG